MCSPKFYRVGCFRVFVIGLNLHVGVDFRDRSSPAPSGVVCLRNAFAHIISGYELPLSLMFLAEFVSRSISVFGVSLCAFSGVFFVLGLPWVSRFKTPVCFVLWLNLHAHVSFVFPLAIMQG